MSLANVFKEQESKTQTVSQNSNNVYTSWCFTTEQIVYSWEMVVKLANKEIKFHFAVIYTSVSTFVLYSNVIFKHKPINVRILNSRYYSSMCCFWRMARDARLYT